MTPYFRWLSDKCRSCSLKRYMALGIIVKKSLNLYKVDDCGYLKGFEFGIHVENLDFDKL